MFGFKKKDYVFLVKQSCITGDKQEDILRLKVLDYTNSFLSKKRKIEYIDHFSDYTAEAGYYFMTTFIPKDNQKFTPLLYEIYAFIKTNQENIFDDYKFEKKVFSDERQTMTVYKIQL